MKGLARSHVWWPGIDKGIEEVTHACQGCQRMKQNPKLSTLHPWEFPEGPGKRIHIDFAGPFENKTLLCVVDAYSKWPETLKQALRSSRKDGRTFQHRLASFLMNYRNARHATTEESPARLMIGRDVRSRLHLLTPDLAGTVAKNQSVQASGTERWCQAQVKAKVGPKTYHVQVGGSNLWKRHVEQMIRSGSDQLGVSGPREDSEVPVPIICQEADTTHPTPMLPSIPYNGVGAALVSPQVGGRSEETREVPSLETREPTRNDEERGSHGDEVLGKEQNGGGTPNPSAVPATDGHKRNPDERPITSTRSGRIVRKPARYREEGEKM
ncbi:hypothetical protein EMCRGX_G015098 [Ephydatia muelleri]